MFRSLTNCLLGLISLALWPCLLIAQPVTKSRVMTSLKTEQQGRREVLRWLKEFQLDINLLSPREDSANWTRYKKNILVSYGIPDTMSVPHLLQPESLYRDTQGTTQAQLFLNDISRRFYEGFQYEIDTAAAALSPTACTGNRCQLTVTTAVQLHGLAGRITRREAIADLETFTIGGTIKKGRFVPERLIAIHSVGTPENGVAEKAGQLTVRKIAGYQQQLLTGTLTIARGDAPAEHRIEKENQLYHLLSSDTIYVKWDSAAAKPITLTQLRALKIKDEKLRHAKIISFDVMHDSNFYRDVDDQVYGERIYLRGVCASLDKPQFYDSKTVNVIPLPKKFDQQMVEQIKISNVILSLEPK